MNKVKRIGVTVLEDETESVKKTPMYEVENRRRPSLSNLSFSKKLFLKTLSENKSGNLIVSPFSVFCALAMLYAGSAESTAKELANLLDIGLKPGLTLKELANLYELIIKSSISNGNKMRISNAFFAALDMKMKDEYVNNFKNASGKISNLDFADSKKSTDSINDWVNHETEGKIQQIIPEGLLDVRTRAVIVNAIYQYAKWLYEFDESLTREDGFICENNEEGKASYMKMKKRFNYFSNNLFQVVEIKHKGEATSMIFALPGFGYGLDVVTDYIEEKGIDSLFPKESVEGTVIIPKFKVEFGDSLVKSLKELGIEKSFDGQANFSGIADESLYVSEILHKAVVEINEKGSEAAAATAAQMFKCASFNNKTFVFKAAKPFLFFIRHNLTNTILFAGRISKF